MSHTDIFLRKYFQKIAVGAAIAVKILMVKAPKLSVGNIVGRKKRITETTCDTPLNCYFDYPADRCFWKT